MEMSLLFLLSVEDAECFIKSLYCTTVVYVCSTEQLKLLFQGKKKRLFL